MKYFMCILVLTLSLVICSQASALTLKSRDFADGEKLPLKTGYEKSNISPVIEWEDIPENTASFVLIMDDPDASGWVHWLIYNIPASVNSLRDDFPRDEKFKDGTMQGVNSFNKVGYGGPCPPRGTHRYVFKLFALDTLLELEPKAQKSDLLKAIKGHIIQEATLTGKFSK